MCKTRFQLRTSDEILNRLEALSSISGESKNSVANVLLALQLGGVKCDVTSKRGKSGSNSEEPKESSVVHDDGDDESSENVTSLTRKRFLPLKPPLPKRKKIYLKVYPKKKKFLSEMEENLGHSRNAWNISSTDAFPTLRRGQESSTTSTRQKDG